MLEAHEFTAGSLAQAKPLSLILPRNDSQYPILVGHIDGEVSGGILSKHYAFECLEGDSSGSWCGLVIPNIRIEVDEASVFNTDYLAGAPGTIIRSDTRLLLRVKPARSRSREKAITLYDGLPNTELTVGFSCWQIVIGSGDEKRVLWTFPSSGQSAKE